MKRKKRRAYTGIEPVTSRTLSENHTTRPAGQQSETPPSLFKSYNQPELVFLIHLKMSTEKSQPSDFIRLIYGKPVVVKLYSGTVYKGM